MLIVRNIFLASMALLMQIPLHAQTANLSIEPATVIADSIPVNSNQEQEVIKNKFPVKSFIIPAALITYGAVTMGNHGPNSINGKLQDQIWINKPHATRGIDNFLMFVPAVSVYALNAFGVKGKNNFKDRTMIYLMSNIISNVIVYPTKTFTNEIRPNGKKYYLMAAATGYLRMYNNKHWFSDVVAGAGVGIASTQLSYWLYPKIKKAFSKNKPSNTIVMPTYNNGSFGLTFSKQF